MQCILVIFNIISMATKLVADSASNTQLNGNTGTSLQNDVAYIPSKYSKAFNSYSRNQIKLVMPFIASISRTCSYSSLYPICKVLKAISKIFMLNEIQVIFLAYLIRETQWDIKDKTIYHNAQNVQDIIYYSIDNLDYKRIILYLMVTAFTVKYYLNQNTNDILEEINKRCPNFKQIFQGWNKKHSSIISKINPRTLNTVYKRLYCSVKENQLDFNMIVDAIIQISPAYNPEREKHGQENKKKNNQKDHEILLKKEEFTLKHNKSGLILPGNALFSSSGLLNMMAFHHHQQQQQQHHQPIENSHALSGLNPFMQNRSDSLRQDYLGILGSSVVGGLQPNYDIKEEDDCGELMVGLNDGQSQENILIQEKVNNPNNSVVNITSSVGGFQLYNQPNSSQANFPLPVAQQAPYYTSIINLSRRISNENYGKDSFGTSDVMLMGGGSGINPGGLKSKVEASVVSYSVVKNIKDKEEKSQ